MEIGIVSGSGKEVYIRSKGQYCEIASSRDYTSRLRGRAKKRRRARKKKEEITR